MTTTKLRGLRLATLLLPLALSLSACQWAPAPVPADPGLNAQLRGRSEDALVPTSAGRAAYPDDDPGAGQLYAQHCARCHDLIAPATIRAVEWPRYVRRYGPRAGLYGADRARVLRWLQARGAP